MSSISPKILEQDVSTAESVTEMRGYACAAVEARLASGRQRAVHEAARELGLTPRRVVGLLRGEVARVWADELLGARAWYRGFLEREHARAEHRALILRAQREALDAQDAEDRIT